MAMPRAAKSSILGVVLSREQGPRYLQELELGFPDSFLQLGLLIFVITVLAVVLVGRLALWATAATQKHPLSNTSVCGTCKNWQ